MNKFGFQKLRNNKKIRYLHHQSNTNIYVVFLHGFMSDLEGNKPRNFLSFCKNKNLGFLGMEYSGHGKSSGKFIKGNISKWSEEVKYIIKKIIKKNKFLIVGSSMGSWLALNQFKFFEGQIIGFLGIGSAPEFLDLLMWKKFSTEIKSEIKKKGIYHLKHGNYEYPITYQLIKDGRKNKVLNKKINSDISVSMVHGSKDEVVPVSFSRKVLKLFKSKHKRMLIIKNGDHSLSNKACLKKINSELTKILKNINN